MGGAPGRTGRPGGTDRTRTIQAKERRGERTVSKKPGRTNPVAAAARADRRRTLGIQLGVTAVLIALIAAIGIGLAVRNSGSDDMGPVPAVATDNGAIRVGQPDAKATVRIVADMQCPICHQFENDHKELLNQAVANGTAAIEYNIVGYLDKVSSTEYSSRAANASYCVAESGIDNYPDWLELMFQNQPPEGGAGLTDEKMIELAEQAGYTDPAVADCVTNRTYDKYVAAKTQDSMDEGINGTPTVFVNGEKVNLQVKNDRTFNTQTLADAIDSAAGR